MLRHALLVVALCGALAAPASAAPGPHGIYRVDLDGRTALLGQTAPVDGAPSVAVSPDGQQIAFARGRDLYAIGVDGRGLRRVTSGLPAPVPIAWAPDDRRLIVTTTTPVRAGRYHDLWVVGPGSAQRRLGRSLCGFDTAAWSPDGRRIASNECSRTVRMRELDGHVLRSVTTHSGASFSWSRGGRLAVLADRAIRVYDATGRAVSRFPGDGLAWSADGTRLASMAGGAFESRAGGAGRPVIRKRLFSEAEVGRIQLYRPQLLWLGAGRVAIGNVSRTNMIFGPSAPTPGMVLDTSVEIPSGRIVSVSRKDWFAGSCGCRSADGARVAYTAKAGTAYVLRVAAADWTDARTLAAVGRCSDDGGSRPALWALRFVDGGRSLIYVSGC